MSDAPVGSVEDEARRLGDALRRARRDAPPVDAGVPGAGAGRADAPGATSPVRRLHPVGASESTRAGASASAASEEETRPEHPGTQPCESCPWCRSRRWARAHGPQMLRDLADAGDLLVRGLRSAARTLEERVDGPASGTTAGGPTGDAPAPTDPHAHDDAREQA